MRETAAHSLRVTAPGLRALATLGNVCRSARICARADPHDVEVARSIDRRDDEVRGVLDARVDLLSTAREKVVRLGETHNFKPARTTLKLLQQPGHTTLRV